MFARVGLAGAALRVIAVLTVATLVLLLFWGFALRQSVPSHPNNVDVLGASRCSASPTELGTHLAFKDFDPSKGVLVAEVQLCATEELLTNVRDTKSIVQPRLFEIGGYALRLKKEFQNRRFRYAIYDADTNRELLSKEVAFATLATSAERSRGLTLGTVSLMVDGAPEAFPLDRYNGRTIAVEIDSPNVVVHADGDTTYSYLVDSPVSFEKLPALSGFRASVYPDNGLKNATTPFIERSWLTRIFASALVLVPLLLFFGLVALLRNSDEPGGANADVVLGAAGAILAILPIRSVLVPTDLPSVTLVDLALGVEVALLSALLVWLATRRPTTPPAAYELIPRR